MSTETEWGIRLEEAGKKPAEFKIPAGKSGAEDYAAFVNDVSATCRMRGDKATVIVRAAPGKPWQVPGGN